MAARVPRFQDDDRSDWEGLGRLFTPCFPEFCRGRIGFDCRCNRFYATFFNTITDESSAPRGRGAGSKVDGGEIGVDLGSVSQVRIFRDAGGHFLPGNHHPWWVVFVRSEEPDVWRLKVDHLARFV